VRDTVNGPHLFLTAGFLSLISNSRWILGELIALAADILDAQMLWHSLVKP